MTDPEAREGLRDAALAYVSWGLFPLFWKQLSDIPASEQLVHRIVWAAAFMFGLLVIRGRAAEPWQLLRDPVHGAQRRRWLALSSLLLGANWFVFLLAIHTDRVLHASLGYYLNPLVSVVLGTIFLGERLRRLQWLAVGAAALGVGVLIVRGGEVPWIGVVLALAFGFYGLIRKRVDVDPLPGSTIEATLLGVPCLVAIVGMEVWLGTGHYLASPRATALLTCTGLVTALPILWFTSAARRLSLFALGFMQYIAPTAQFLLAVLVFGETFTVAHAVAFALIWAGVGLFGADLLEQGRRRRRSAAQTAPRSEGTPAPPREAR